MSIRKLPKIEALVPPKCLQWEEPDGALARWSPEIRAADDSGISILGHIGESFDGSGVTARRIAAALRSIGEKDVTVAINSPGGDFFEGIAIYNLLREHKAKVTVKVMGLAASAASVIAMAGDEVRIAKSGFLMIHNAMAVVIGNRNDMEQAIDALQKFDASMAGLYADRTGMKRARVEKMMDDETWIGGEDAVAMGFADSLLAADEVVEGEIENTRARLLRRVETALAKDGVTRSERREMLKELTGKPSAAGGDTPCAVATATPSAGLLAELAKLNEALRIT